MSVPVDWPLALTRAIHFIAVVQLAGLWLTLSLVTGPVLGRTGPVAAQCERRAQRLGWACLAIALLSGAAWLALRAVRMSGQPLSPELLATVVTRTQFGQVFILRLGLAAALAGLLMSGGTRARAARPIIAMALAVSLAGLGHAAARQGTVLAIQISADAVHLLSASAWLGGLTPLAWALMAARRVGGDAGQQVAWALAKRFSFIGLGSLVLLFATGLINTCFLVGTLPALIGTDYGRVLLVKLGLFAVLLALAAINARVLTPRLRHSEEAARRLARNAWIEAGLGAALLAAVGLLGALPSAVHAPIQ